MDTNGIILTAVDIHREFKTAEGVLSVLNGVDLELKRGEVASITGASGVGKSTLLHILGGLDSPTSGEVTLSGELLSGQSQKALSQFRNEKVGFVFQFHYLLEDFSALENVMIPQLVAGKSHTEARKQGEQILENVGLSNRTSHRPNQLSGGEQQRVAVARALANDPEIVLADEPSGNLDTTTGRKLHELLFQLSRECSTTFLIATHNIELAERCEQRFDMVDGKIQRHDR